MFKSTRWRSEKTKIKAVFKLQFQATQVPQLKAKTLTISLVPADVGKPTVRLEKAAIKDGTCFWENPVYETVKLIKEVKTGKFNEKFYHFVVSTGSSKAGLLGEVSINFADHVEAAKSSIVSLPLKTSNHGGTGTILHVTIHNMQGSDDQRDSEACEAPQAKSQDRSLKNQLKSQDRNRNINNYDEDEYISEFASENSKHIGNFRNLLMENPITCQDDTSLRQENMPKKRTVDVFPNNSHTHQRSKTEWSVVSASEGSLVDLLNSPEANIPIDRSPEGSDRSIEKLEREIHALERQTEVSELELQSLRKQIVKETKRGQGLTRQIISLKEERNGLKTECKQLKSSLKNTDDAGVSNQLQMETQNFKVILEEIRQELNHEKDWNNTLRLQLRKTEDSNSEMILAIRDLDEMLEQKNREIADLSSIIKAIKNEKETPKEVLDSNNEAKEVDMLKQKITDLYDEIEVYRKDREELKVHLEQLATDYEILKQENEDLYIKLEQNEIEQIKMQNECSEYLANMKEFKLQTEGLEKEIKKQALQLSESSDTIKEYENRVKNLEKELEKQAQAFENDLEGITLAKIEQEQKAIRAEEALRKTRSNNAVAAERIQEEYRRLTVEMSSKFDENEKLAMKSATEANDLRLQKRVLEEMLQKANEELGIMKEHYEVKLQELSKQKDLRSKQIEQMSQELKENFKQIENFKKQGVEIQKLKGEIERLKINNVFSKEARLKEKLRGDSDHVEKMKTSIGEQDMMERRSKEGEKLRRELASARKETQKCQEESKALRSLKDEKETMVSILQSDIEKLRVQHDELKRCLAEVVLEKDNLRKEVFKLEGDLQKKEEAVIITEKKLKSNNEQAGNQYTNQTSSKGSKSSPLSCGTAKDVVSEKVNFVERVTEEALPFDVQDAAPAVNLTANARELNIQISGMRSTAGVFKENGVATAPVKSERETWTEKGLNMSLCPASDDCHLTPLVNEMALLKEMNKCMEGELKEMQERYSEISLKFAEVEGERQQLVMTVRNLKNNKKNY